MERNHFSKPRLAVLAVLTNLALITLLACTLHGDATILLPLLALTLPLLTAALFDDSDTRATAAAATQHAPSTYQAHHAPDHTLRHAA